MLRNFDNFDDFNLPTRTWGTNNNGVDAKNVKLNNGIVEITIDETNKVSFRIKRLLWTWNF